MIFLFNMVIFMFRVNFWSVIGRTNRSRNHIMYSSFTWTPSWQHRQNFRRRADEERSADFLAQEIISKWERRGKASVRYHQQPTNYHHIWVKGYQVISNAFSLPFPFKKKYPDWDDPSTSTKKKQSKDMAHSSNEGCDHATAWLFQVICTPSQLTKIGTI